MSLKGNIFTFGASLGLSLLLSRAINAYLAKSDGSEARRKDEGPTVMPSEIEEELFSRVRSFFGDEGHLKLRNAFVIVVGLGGVGSHAANMLVRSGVGKLRLIDFDQVTLSSLNRHAVACMEDVGTSKAIAMKSRLQSIVPGCDVEAVTEMFVGSSAERLLSGSPIYVLDCIDDINTKAELISACKRMDLTVLTSMGAGGKSDPTKIRIGTLGDCVKDPLASKIKWKLKKYDISADDVMAVYSCEKPVASLLPLDEEQRQNPQDFGAVDYLRLRVIPVLGTSPSIFGQAMASYTLCALAERPYAAEACERMSMNLRQKVKKQLLKTEKERFGSSVGVNLDEDDVELIVQQVWAGRCAVSGKRFGGHNPLLLTRWREDQLPTMENLVLLAQSEATLLHSKGRSSLPPESVKRIEERLVWATSYFGSQDDGYPSDIDLVAASARFSRIQSSTGNIDSTTLVAVGATLITFSMGMLMQFSN